MTTPPDGNAVPTAGNAVPNITSISLAITISHINESKRRLRDGLNWCGNCPAAVALQGVCGRHYGIAVDHSTTTLWDYDFSSVVPRRKLYNSKQLRQQINLFDTNPSLMVFLPGTYTMNIYRTPTA